MDIEEFGLTRLAPHLGAAVAGAQAGHLQAAERVHKQVQPDIKNRKQHHWFIASAQIETTTESPKWREQRLGFAATWNQDARPVPKWMGT
ncbi:MULTISPECIES: hypothetical protein [unclassified Bradyrhizobium]